MHHLKDTDILNREETANNDTKEPKGTEKKKDFTSTSYAEYAKADLLKTAIITFFIITLMISLYIYLNYTNSLSGISKYLLKMIGAG